MRIVGDTAETAEKSAEKSAERPLFAKLHESCCDDATAAELLKLPGVASLADVPCHPHAGNPWC